MWSVLKQDDLSEARRALDSRRTEMLRRHTEEIEQLAADQAEIETLRRLATAFSEKFKTALAPPAPAAPPAPNRYEPPPREPWRGAQREQPRTNFGTFSLALARGF
jgi:anti-sigma factor RsiW